MLDRLLHGHPPVLPAWLDRLSERWATATTWVRVCVITAVTAVALIVAGRGAATSPWGPEVAVLVAARPLPAGHVLEAGDTEPARWPQRLVPVGTPSHPDDVVGRTLAASVPAAALVTGGHLAVDGVAAELEAGRVAYPLPVPDGSPLSAGQLVDLVTGDGEGGGVRLAAGARVLAVDGTTAWIALARDEAPAVAGAAAWGEVVAVVLPSGSSGERR